MDSETVKTVISAVSAVVALASAGMAYRARVQTRADIFENNRDALVLAMAENDNRCSNIALQVAFSRSVLAKLRPQLTVPCDDEEAAGYLRNLNEIEEMTKVFELREYNANKLDELKYSESGLATVRRMARGEQVNAKHLGPASFDLIFAEIARFTARSEAERAA